MSVLNRIRPCTCTPCLRAWTFRAAGILALAADMYAAVKFGWL